MNASEGYRLLEMAFDNAVNIMRSRIVIIGGEESISLPENYDLDNDPDGVFSKGEDYFFPDNMPADSDTVFNILKLCKAIADNSECEAFDIKDMAQGIAAAATASETGLSPGADFYRGIAEKHISGPVEMGYDPDTSSIYAWFRTNDSEFPRPSN